MNYSLIVNPKDNITFEIINNILILATSKINLKSVNKIFISKDKITIIYETQIVKKYYLIEIFLNEQIKLDEKIYYSIKYIYNFIKNIIFNN